MRRISCKFFALPTLEVAPRLIGCLLSVGDTVGRIVEVEAYTDDPASHAHRRTSRSEIMFETYGYVYVYYIYGANHCVNITTDAAGAGAVLIRALEPLKGIERMKRRRGVRDVRNLCSGPGKLCQALGIDLTFNWTKVGDLLQLHVGSSDLVSSGPRIGISKATDLHWRFFEADNLFVSRHR